jgi:uncharacterized protein YukE
MRMVAMNLALEAARGGAPMQGFLGIADELRGLADDAAARAGALSSALADMGSGVQEAARAAEGAGAAIHEAAQAAGKISRAASSIGKGLEPLAAQAERAGASAARVHDLGASSDLGRSALAGVARVVGRIVTLTGEMTSTARGESKATAAGQPAAAEPRITAAADKN